MQPDPVNLITTNTALTDLVERLGAEPWVAMDTEFMRERTYYPQLCLIQIASKTEIACVDPLADIDLDLLRPLLQSSSTLKVFHAAFQDMEALLQSCGCVPAPVFDTQIAATLIGQPDQMGYARLVQAMLGVELEKSHARTDWARRPLAPEELQYAADDVRYLARLYPLLRDDLAARGRLRWLTAEFEAMTDPGRYVTEPGDAWKRIKAWKKLKPAQIGALRALAAWRETLAMEADRPRGWIIKDDVLGDIARRRPRDLAALGRIRGLADATLNKHGDRLLALVRDGASQPIDATPPPANRLSAEQQALADLLMAGLRLRAAAASISPSAIASRGDVERVVLGERDPALLHGWRREAAGGFVEDLLAGRTQLQVVDGELRAVEDG
jgi:ribonuclease D